VYKNKKVPVTLLNPLNSEIWVCDDYTKVQSIDGVDYITVYKKDNNRRFLMRRDALKKISHFTSSI